jgi:tetratricopeptide (TPR) repeat protein
MSLRKSWAISLLIEGVVMMFDVPNYLFNPTYAANKDLKKAIAHIRKGNYDEAIRILNTAIHLVPEDVYLHANRGVAHAYKHEYRKAIRDFSAALERKPHDPGVLYANRGSSYSRIGDLDAAIKDYAEALRSGLDLNHAIQILSARGRDLIKLGEIERADANYRAILDLDPSVWDSAYLGFAEINLTQKDYESAIENYAKALSLNPSNENAYCNRGYAYIKGRNWEQALADIEESIRLMPNSAYSFNNRGVVRSHLGDLQGALEDYEKALLINPVFHNAYSGIGEVNFLLGRFDAALQALITAHEHNPENPFTLATMAVTYHALSQVERAVEIWQGLIAKDEHYGDADWVKQEHTWPEPLVEVARKLIARLPKIS